MKKSILGFLAIAVVVIAALFIVSQVRQRAQKPLTEVSFADLQKTIDQSKTPVFVMLTAPNCQNCAQLESMLAHSAAKFAGKMTFVKVDVSKDARLSQKIPADKLPVFTIVDPELGQVTPFITGVPPSQQSLDASLQKVIDAIARVKDQLKNAPANPAAPAAPAQPDGK